MSAREAVWHQLVQKGSWSRSAKRFMDQRIRVQDGQFGLGGGEVGRGRAGSGWMAGLGFSKMGRSLLIGGTQVIVCIKVQEVQTGMVV